MILNVKPLGQAGFRFQANGIVVYIDPYLSDFVAEQEGDRFRRLVSIPILPQDVHDADWVLISHIHLDHCDPATLKPLSMASPQCRFVGPAEVIRFLADELEIVSERLVIASEEWFSLAERYQIRAIPAAHKQIEKDVDGYLRFVGYLMEIDGRRFYHSGDCSIHPSIVKTLKGLTPIECAFLPVNECNYYRDREGIIGNMSVREAFAFAEEVGMIKVVPMHYDMFAVNSVYPEEIDIVYRKSNPSFDLVFEPKEL